MRAHQRAVDELRPVRLNRNYIQHAEGSVLVEFGNTRVLCTASIEEGVPSFLRGRGRGWLTAEYGMLPRSTQQRMRREATLSRQSGRTMEIQRLIGRSLRAVLDLDALPELTIQVDCDVIQADGGTRTAAITGACVALADALRSQRIGKVCKGPLSPCMIASVSVGIVSGQVLLDMDYSEDSQAQTDMNVVMNERGEFIEIQGSAEGNPFSSTELHDMLTQAQKGIEQLLEWQRQALRD